MQSFIQPGQDYRRLGGWLGGGLMVSTLLGIGPVVVSPAWAATVLSSWQFDPATQAFTMTLPSGVVPQYTVAAEPARIVLTIPQTQLGDGATEQRYSGAVSRVELSQLSPETLQVVLELAPGTVLEPSHAQLVSIPAGDQTRWVLTPLIAQAGTTATITPPVPGSSSLDSADSAPLPSAPSHQMIVELPVIPAARGQLGFPDAGEGRLSTSAANLMLQEDIDNLTNLPDTLPIDPFNIGLASGEQISVPSLDELDAAVGPVVRVPQLPAPTAAAEASPAIAPDVAQGTAPIAVQTPELALPAPTINPPSEVALTTEPPSTTTLSPNSEVSAGTDLPPVAEIEVPEAEAPDVAISPDPSIALPIDAETDGVAIPVTPSENSAEIATVETLPIDAETNGVAIPVVPPENNAEIATVETQPELEPPVLNPEEATSPLGESEFAADFEPAPVLTQEPPAQVASGPELAPIPVEPAPEVAPEVASEPATPPDSDWLRVPALPIAEDVAAVPPAPEVEPVFLAATGETVLFGQPLPVTGGKALEAEPAVPAPNQSPIAPDVLIAAGTVLEMRYPGSAPLTLDPNSNLNEVLLLETEIRDPITNGVLAPAGSQLIGQFEPSGTNQRWVSQMLIVPAGQRVPFASTSEYLVGSPQVNGGSLAIGTGVGALALTLLTGFSGIGLIGGAIMGATTALGTSPQHIVIEPNQIIQVQVMQDVPRSVPIAAAPARSLEWGTAHGEWGVGSDR